MRIFGAIVKLRSQSVEVSMFRSLIACLGASILIAINPFSAIAATDDLDTDLATVDSAALGTDPNLPWSEPVQINDPFEGNFVGVFDRHAFYDRFLNTDVRIEVQSLWTEEFIRVLSVVRDRDCLSHPAGVVLAPGCTEFSNARNITRLFIKINDEVFQIAGQGSTFAVSSELAAALQTAPAETISIRLVSESGEIIDSEIGEATAAAWQTVYGSEAIATTPVNNAE
jgi:hypothetical protein